jgi:hypothetical protein
MNGWYSVEMEGELLLIGLIAIIGAFVYHKLDKMMQLQERTNSLLERLVTAKDENDKDKKN